MKPWRWLVLRNGDGGLAQRRQRRWRSDFHIAGGALLRTIAFFSVNNRSGGIGRARRWTCRGRHCGGGGIVARWRRSAVWPFQNGSAEAWVSLRHCHFLHKRHRRRQAASAAWAPLPRDARMAFQAAA